MDHPRRDVYVGPTTLKALYAQRFIPGLADRYLARTAWEGQTAPEPDDPGRPDNLHDPLPGDAGARGRFDDRALDHSLQAWTATHREGLLALGAAAGLAAGLLLARRRG
jgi:hypothetical protein